MTATRNVFGGFWAEVEGVKECPSARNGEWEWRIENALESEFAGKAQSAPFFIATNARRSRAGRQKVLKKSGKPV
jgi:hypothetical protein